ncbi:MAG: class I poly(R)-hydroxyalkanoic acid synthase [Rhodothermales bacterium]|nr:class I poly(R)-hydroxyalkanoic acid synthase [Rhodothermales bacterium]
MKQFSSIAEQSQRAVQAFWQRQLEEGNKSNFSLTNNETIGNAFLEWSNALAKDPNRILDAQLAFWKEQTNLWQSMVRRAMGEKVDAGIEPDKGDRRFKNEAWNENMMYDYLKQSYLLSAKWVRGITSETEGLDRASQEKVDFYTRQFLSALSPTNFAATNPAVLQKTRDSGGQNLVDGLQHLLADLEKGKGRLKISMTDETAFKVGQNVATTPGKVIYQNDLMQLIQYEPSTAEVYRRPLLIVPPWINKFYILDLQPKNSFIKHAVDQGHTVFVISWVNPNENHASKSFEDYMELGPLAALDAIEEATGEQEATILGFCIGGILVSATLAYLAASGTAKRIKAATFLTSLFDFKDVGEVSVFIDEEQITQIEKHVAETGYLDGHHMADMFAMMRENDLIWSFVVNNYLLGKEPLPFDLLYWNSDSTRLPASMLVFYLKQVYQNNLLKESGGIQLKNTPIDLTKIKTPTYFMAAKEDHIAPWQSCYPGTQLFSGSCRFVLAASGHIAGVVNPPGAKKYGHWTRDELPSNASEWFEQASWNEGSWWPDWYSWLARRSGAKVPARKPGDGQLPALEDAPGSYVLQRSSD